MKGLNTPVIYSSQALHAVKIVFNTADWGDRVTGW